MLERDGSEERGGESNAFSVDGRKEGGRKKVKDRTGDKFPLSHRPFLS